MNASRLQEEEERRRARKRKKGRIRELEEIRAELAEKVLGKMGTPSLGPFPCRVAVCKRLFTCGVSSATPAAYRRSWFF